jgi:GT2 family glycosyltransferase
VKPLLAIPVLTRPDELARCLQSIDYPVDLLVIDNSDQGFAAATVVEHYEGEFYVTEPPANLGFAASVNLAIRTHPRDPYWLIANADIKFGPGDIERLCAEMEQGGARWVGLTDWRCFGLTQEAVDRAGLWDENFHPCYCEDADYEYRCDLTGVQRYAIDSTTDHIRSIVLEDARYDRHNRRTYPDNVAYYEAKWGGTLRGGEKFTTPFGEGNHPRAWTLDRRRLAANDWT